jgi:hypothetical protein
MNSICIPIKGVDESQNIELFAIGKYYAKKKYFSWDRAIFFSFTLAH